MGGVQSDEHGMEYVLIHLFPSHNDLSLSSPFPTSSTFFVLKFSHFSSFLLSLFFSFFDSAAFREAKAFNSDISKWEVSKVTYMAYSPFQFIYFLLTTTSLFSSPFSPTSSSSFFALKFSHFFSFVLSLFSSLTLQCFFKLMHSTRTSRNGRCPK